MGKPSDVHAGQDIKPFQPSKMQLDKARVKLEKDATGGMPFTSSRLRNYFEKIESQSGKTETDLSPLLVLNKTMHIVLAMGQMGHIPCGASTLFLMYQTNLSQSQWQLAKSEACFIQPPPPPSGPKSSPPALINPSKHAF